MKRLDTTSKIGFDRSIGTEDRFTLRRWFEQSTHAFNQSNPTIWEEYLDAGLVVSGFTDTPMNVVEYAVYLRNCFNDGVYVGRYPRLDATYKVGLFILSGTFESFIDGVLTCSGEITIEIARKSPDMFKLKSLKLNPRFRVQK